MSKTIEVTPIEVTKLKVTLPPRQDGHFFLYIGDSVEGVIYFKNEKYWADEYNEKDSFPTAQEAAMRFLKNKAYLDWSEEEMN